jgi:hypothetical protein
MKRTIICAPTDLIDQLHELARDFFSDIIGSSYDNFLVTDESLMRDCITDETPADYAERFREKYGFELEGIGSTRVIDILKAIDRARRDLAQSPN